MRITESVILCRIIGLIRQPDHWPSTKSPKRLGGYWMDIVPNRRTAILILVVIQLWQNSKRKTQKWRVCFFPAESSSMPLITFVTYLFIPLSVGMFPHLFQHWLTARNAKAFKLTVIAHPICIMIVWVPCVLIGSWASGLLPPAIPPPAVLSAMLNMLVGDPLLTGLLTAGVLAAIMSSLDSQFLCLGTRIYQ